MAIHHKAELTRRSAVDRCSQWLEKLGGESREKVAERPGTLDRSTSATAVLG